MRVNTRTQINLPLAFVVIRLSAPGCGVVRYQEMVVSVRDEVTNAPIRDVYISAQFGGEMGKWNSGSVPMLQRGYTNEHGEWKVTLPENRGARIMVDSLGYERQNIDLEAKSIDGGRLDIKLTPHTIAPDSGAAPRSSPDSQRASR